MDLKLLTLGMGLLVEFLVCPSVIYHSAYTYGVFTSVQGTVLGTLVASGKV